MWTKYVVTSFIIFLWFPKPSLTQRMFCLNSTHNTASMTVYVSRTIYNVEIMVSDT